MGENGSFQGLWIPREILLLPISIMQKVLLAEIMALSQRKGVCFASNKYLADFIHTSPDTVKRCLAGLKEAGYISITGPTCTRKICICTSNLVQKCTTLGAESPELGAKMHLIEYREYKENAKKTLAKGLNAKELTGNFTKRFTAAKDLSTKWAVITDSIGEIVSKPAEYISEKLTAASNSIYEFLFETEKEASPGKRVKGFFNLITEKTNIMFNKMVSKFEEKIWDPLKEKLGLGDAKSYLKKFGSAVGNSFMSKARGLGNIVNDAVEDLTREPDQNSARQKIAQEYNAHDVRRLGRLKRDQEGKLYVDDPNPVSYTHLRAHET